MKNLKWALVFLGLTAVCALTLVFHKSVQKPPKTARIIQDGEIIREVDLQRVAEPYEFEVVYEGNTEPSPGRNTVRVEQGKIAVVGADCPDKICVRQGFIENGVLPIVCLPHKLTISVSGDSADTDAVSGGLAQ